MAAKQTVKHWAGFDLGGTKMRVAIYNDEFRAVASAEGKTRSS